jgi:hypothetical protein
MKRCFCLIAAMVAASATPALASEASPSAPPTPAGTQRIGAASATPALARGRRPHPRVPSALQITRRWVNRFGKVSPGCARSSRDASGMPSKPRSMKPMGCARTAPTRTPRLITIPSATSARPTAPSASIARTTPDGVRRGPGHLPPDRAVFPPTIPAVIWRRSLLDDMRPVQLCRHVISHNSVRLAQ